ncbi:MAG: phospho-sugar mutase [Verrucomicrobiota bacterium JB022]|nr:phospho-sugar mutase [Verrucomicrobiota bacterium JB022]
MSVSATLSQLQQAHEAGKLLDSTLENATAYLQGGFMPAWGEAAMAELVEKQAWDELNDRFYQTLKFGTGGMRSRTIGNVVTAAERGTPGPQDTPEHAAVGSAMMNDFNVIRATVGLFRYCERHLEKSLGRREAPRLVIAHDVRHFSRHFCELTASVWTKLGGYAMIFDGPRSTPQLSFTVRYTKATAGIVITASHNPAHDNGYKVYFEDGAQVVFPNAEGIIHEVYQVKLADTAQYLDKDLAGVVTLPATADAAYLEVMQENLLDKEVFKRAQPEIVFSPIHGTGGVSGPQVLKNNGLEVSLVEKQMVQDSRFPTVKSPNPENAEALAMAIAQAQEIGADVVLATDPDSDRMGAAVRDENGQMVLLTGNMIGSLLADYRINKLKEQGVLPKSGTKNAALIKTYVTTPLQAAIAEKNGLKVINTLTGFKWIGEKLRDYQQQIVDAVKKEQGIAIDYDKCSLEQRRKLALAHSTFYVFGGEESYGYLASDLVRDKDANAAVLMFAELAASLKAQGKTFPQYLDEVYLRYGYYLERLVNIYYEGASGSQKIKNILDSYRNSPPEKLGEFMVTSFKDFGRQDLFDADGKETPKENFYFLELDNGYQFAVRGSGTEPKIKFYLFASEDVPEPAALDDVKESVKQTLATLAEAIEADARQRAEG